MADITHSAPSHSRIGNVFAHVGAVLTKMTESNHRVRQAKRLHEMSDAELAAGPAAWAALPDPFPRWLASEAA